MWHLVASGIVVAKTAQVCMFAANAATVPRPLHADLAGSALASPTRHGRGGHGPRQVLSRNYPGHGKSNRRDYRPAAGGQEAVPEGVPVEVQGEGETRNADFHGDGVRGDPVMGSSRRVAGRGLPEADARERAAAGSCGADAGMNRGGAGRDGKAAPVNRDQR